ncbi:hypothetical protein PR048_000487 [Dryococelus australis]|uniref:Transmembrane protein n=1 Tax=Dryococelus australis TaxID=614101 RepID=A0ABQ9IFA8_9NEOP|nr:hypothetical protein PR048_000487 [Dryococelus australis]
MVLRLLMRRLVPILLLRERQQEYSSSCLLHPFFMRRLMRYVMLLPALMRGVGFILIHGAFFKPYSAACALLSTMILFCGSNVPCVLPPYRRRMSWFGVKFVAKPRRGSHARESAVNQVCSGESVKCAGEFVFVVDRTRDERC